MVRFILWFGRRTRLMAASPVDAVTDGMAATTLQDKTPDSTVCQRCGFHTKHKLLPYASTEPATEEQCHIAAVVMARELVELFDAVVALAQKGVPRRRIVLVNCNEDDTHTREGLGTWFSCADEREEFIKYCCENVYVSRLVFGCACETKFSTVVRAVDAADAERIDNLIGGYLRYEPENQEKLRVLAAISTD